MADPSISLDGGMDCSTGLAEHSKVGEELSCRDEVINTSSDYLRSGMEAKPRVKDDIGDYSTMKSDTSKVGPPSAVICVQYSIDGHVASCDKFRLCLNKGLVIDSGSNCRQGGESEKCDCLKKAQIMRTKSDCSSLDVNDERAMQREYDNLKSPKLSETECIKPNGLYPIAPSDPNSDRYEEAKCDEQNLRTGTKSFSGSFLGGDDIISKMSDNSVEITPKLLKLPISPVSGSVDEPNVDVAEISPVVERLEKNNILGNGQVQCKAKKEEGKESKPPTSDVIPENLADADTSNSNTETVEAHVQISNQDITEPASDNASSIGEYTNDEEFSDEEFEPAVWELIEAASKPLPLYEVGSLSTTACDVCLEESLFNVRPCCQTPVCDTCMTTYIETMISSGKVHIPCPGICQKKYVPRVEIMGRISLEMKEKYHKFLVDANNEPHVKTCPRCSHIMTLDLVQVRNPRVKKKGLPVTCPQCDMYWCFPCQSPWHEGISCKEHKKGDKLLKKWAKEEINTQLNAQRCPKCKIFIQRISGCEHMTCSECGTGFCYRCGERYWRLKFFGDHFSRYSIFGCKYLYMPEKTRIRRLIRGSIFGTRILVAPIVGALALTGGVLLLTSALIFYLPCYGVKRIHKQRLEARMRRDLIEERRRWEEKISDIRNSGDPYLVQYNHLMSLGHNPYRISDFRKKPFLPLKAATEAGPSLSRHDFSSI